MSLSFLFGVYMPVLEFPKVVAEQYKTAGESIPNPSRPFKEGIKSSTIVFTADSGHEQRRERANPKRTFEPSWNILTQDQYLTIRDFFLVVLNSKPFLWTHPIEKTKYLVRFTNEIFQGENKGHGPKGPWYTLNLSLLQVWS